MSFADRLRVLLRRGRLDEDLFQELEDLLVEGDVGAELAMGAIAELRIACKAQVVSDPAQLRALLGEILVSYGREVELPLSKVTLNIILVLGVNGVGKTTTCAKLADYYRRSGQANGIVLAAGDTFRAAAIEQLRIHGQRLGIRVVAQEHGSDPGAVLWDAVEAAKSDGANLVIADSAGRMHTRQDLVRELAKMDKVVSARADSSVYRRLLVIDSTTGQNGLRQAETFNSAVRIDGIVLTKQDSSAKGGLAIALARLYGLPTAFVGTGEGYADIAPFSLRSFIAGFIGSEGG